MNRVTRADRVTPDLASQAQNPVGILDKKQLCERLGWSRPTLDRRLRSDATFPVLHCGKTGEPWQFEVSAVLAHLEVDAARRRRPSRTAGSRPGLPDDLWSEVRRELAEVRALRQAVEAFLARLAPVQVSAGDSP